MAPNPKHPLGPPMTLGNMRQLGVRLAAPCLFGFVGTNAFAAPVVHACGNLNSIANLVEPVKDFANNAIRVAHISTEEPAAAPDHLLIFVSVDPMGVECFAVSAGQNLGFYSLDVANIRGSYDAEKGLLLVVPVSVFDPNKGVGKSAGDVKVRVNRKNGNSVAIEE
jgi:hypothetical protein